MSEYKAKFYEGDKLLIRANEPAEFRIDITKVINNPDVRRVMLTFNAPDCVDIDCEKLARSQPAEACTGVEELIESETDM